VDFAVVAEAVGINGEVVFWPMVGVYGIIGGAAEAAAYIVGFYTRPNRPAGIAIKNRRIFYAMQAGSYEAGKVAIMTISFVICFSHSPSLRGCQNYKGPSIIARMFTFDTKKGLDFRFVIFVTCFYRGS